MADHNTIFKSPDYEHQIRFVFCGEIRFGPFYYHLELDGRQIPDRIFGEAYLWHPESTHLALQEWLTTDYGKGPITALSVIHLSSMKLARTNIATKGFIHPVRFEDDQLSFRTHYAAKDLIESSEINLNEIENWEGL